MPTAIKDFPLDEMVMQGSGACAGCPATAAMRITGKAFGPNAICLMTPSCTVASIGLLPKAAFNYPILNICFATAGASAAGMVYALEALEKKGKLENEKPLVFNWIGDGGTYDIGLQAISAAAERNDDFIHICYNNEAYSNTGVQRSGATPRFAFTTTTPGGKNENRKNMPLLMLDHKIPYLATGSLAYPGDLYDKLVKAKNTKGFRYIEIFAPCYTGWKFPSSQMIKMSKLAVTSGAWPLFEAEYGEVKLTPATKRIADGKVSPTELAEYLLPQGRYQGLKNDPEREEKLALMKQEIMWDLATLKQRER
ncbi:MAG: thiamine pyrophosphate-dependent enzyme [Bacillota bacterium]|jgi:pyruvate ferredoxin oxidoreductase beta subunit